MFLLFHIAIPLFLIFPFKKLNIKYNLFWLFVGSIISDVIDKTASFFNMWEGRGLAHTFLFFIVSFVVLQLVKKDKIKSFSYSIGIIIHFILDLPLPAFFYPLSGNIDFMFDPYMNFSKIDYFMGLFLSNNMLIITELVGFIFCVSFGSYVLIKKYYLNKHNNLYIKSLEKIIIEIK